MPANPVQGKDRTADPRYGHTLHLEGVDPTRATDILTTALAREGFGVVSRIDLSSTLARKLGVEIREYVILGACDPHLAYRALEEEIGIGLLLPCNACIREERGGSVISILNPYALMEIVRNPALEALFHDAARRVRRVLEHVETAAAPAHP
jgi:uncharacterized protein (DUF302 family)